MQKVTLNLSPITVELTLQILRDRMSALDKLVLSDEADYLLVQSCQREKQDINLILLEIYHELNKDKRG